MDENFEGEPTEKGVSFTPIQFLAFDPCLVLTTDMFVPAGMDLRH